VATASRRLSAGQAFAAGGCLHDSNMDSVPPTAVRTVRHARSRLRMRTSRTITFASRGASGADGAALPLAEGGTLPRPSGSTRGG
jgi:hypothetical protein